MVLKYVCASRDENQLLALLRENPEYQTLPRDFAQGLLGLMGYLYKVDNKMEKVDMCKAFRDMEKRGEMRGEMRGKQEERTENAIKFVRFMREKALPEDLLQDFHAKQMQYSPEQIAELCAVH